MKRKGRLSALAPWFGAKRQMADAVVAELGPHRAYYEPFCGSMAVLLAKPVVRHEVVNDLNRDLVNVAKVLQSPILAPGLLGMLHFTLASEETYRAAREVCREPYAGPLGDVERAYSALVTWWLGRNGCAGTRPSRTSFSARFTTKGGLGGVRFRSFVASVPTFTRRLARVDVLNRDGMKVLEQVNDEPGIAIYCDPPYLTKSMAYQHDFAGDDHARLARACNRFRNARVVVSYYPHPELEALYPPDRWRRVERVVQKNMANPSKKTGARAQATELLLVNGPAIPQAKE
jgi:DNA adenine methylase